MYRNSKRGKDTRTRKSRNYKVEKMKRDEKKIAEKKEAAEKFFKPKVRVDITAPHNTHSFIMYINSNILNFLM